MAQPAPTAPDAATSADWQEAGKRRRIIEGPEWAHDVSAYMAARIGRDSLAAWGEPTIASNLLLSVVQAACMLYRKAPVFGSEYLSEDGAAYLADVAPFGRHGAFQRRVLALREYALYVSYAGGYPQVEQVSPDRLKLVSMPGQPSKLGQVQHAVMRENPLRKGEMRWYFDVWDITDPAAPTYSIREGWGRMIDRSGAFGVKSEYLWRDPANGAPYLPWVLYHAEDTGALRDPTGWHQLVDGTYMAAMLFTFWQHIVKNAGWRQAYGLNVKLRGAKPKGDVGTSSARHVTTDPRSLLMFESTDGNGGNLGTLEAPADPEYVLKAIRDASDWILSQVGLAAGDAQRGAESGAALSIRRDGLIEMQQGLITPMRTGDLEYLRTIAQVVNTFSGPEAPALPTDGWYIDYPSAPQKRDEVTIHLDALLKLIEAGLLSRVDVLMEMDPALTREEAALEAARIDAENGKAAPEGAPDAALMRETLADLRAALASGEGTQDALEDLAELMGAEAGEPVDVARSAAPDAP